MFALFVVSGYCFVGGFAPVRSGLPMRCQTFVLTPTSVQRGEAIQSSVGFVRVQAGHVLMSDTRAYAPSRHLTAPHQVVLATREVQLRAVVYEREGLETRQAAEPRGGNSVYPRTRFGAFFRVSTSDRAGQQAGSLALPDNQVEPTLRGSFGATRIASAQGAWQGFGSRRWSPRPSSIAPAPQMRAHCRKADLPPVSGLRSRLPLPQTQLVQVLEKSLELARMRTRAVVVFATTVSVTIVLSTFICGMIDILLVQRASTANTNLDELHDSDDGFGLRAYLYVLLFEIVRSTSLSLAHPAVAFALVAHSDFNILFCVPRRASAPSGCFRPCYPF